MFSLFENILEHVMKRIIIKALEAGDKDNDLLVVDVELELDRILQGRLFERAMSAGAEAADELDGTFDSKRAKFQVLPDYVVSAVAHIGNRRGCSLNAAVFIAAVLE
jgi:hypothetical protein